MALCNKSTVSFLLLGLTAQVQARPNIIIMQPDDLPFLDEWSAPPNLPTKVMAKNTFPDEYGLPNIEYLRLNGVQMMQAYCASPMCGTSRYSTITGKMPSRAASVRDNDDGTSDDPAVVTIPTTKLVDDDCSKENLAKSFQNEDNYKTAMFGKWHLSDIEDEDYNYADARDIVQGCGFDTVEALYIENLSREDGFNNYSDGSFSHNMEWMTYEAISFINTTLDDEKNFFMYFNPTVPHKSNDVGLAITDFACTDVADSEKVWDAEPWIKGMSEDAGCQAYRDSIMDRAGDEPGDAGMIWLDDAVGALLEVLRDNGELNNTVFLFQEDHGMDTKGALYEGGIRIPQFVHYPDGITGGTQFEGLVSTVDIAATMMDFADIEPEYELDGKSWKDAIGNPTEEHQWKTERCLFFEIDRDRAVRCGCYKYLNIFDEVSGDYGLWNENGGNFFDLCDNTDEYITANNNNREEITVDGGIDEEELTEALNCHLEHTNPNSNPDYSVCPESNAVEPPTEEDEDDNDNDTSAPTCGDSPFDGEVTGMVQTFRNCGWIANNNSIRCTLRKYWSHCQESCQKCDDINNCVDSLLTFKYGDDDEEGITCGALDPQSDLCSDADVARTCPATCQVC